MTTSTHRHHARFWALLGVISLLSPLFTQASRAESSAGPQLVRVEFAPGQSVRDLLQAGLDVVEVHDGSAVILAWTGDAERVARLGMTSRVVDAEPGRTAAARARADLASRRTPASKRVWSATAADGRFRTQSLPPFGSGTMGGYWTAAEIKMKLDDLIAGDANDVVADKVDTIGYSREGRPIWGLKIAKSVGGTDTRPVVFYNALTHVREPEGMQAMFYFVDDLLARYNSDAFAKYLLEQRVIYIVPLVNPDGYAVNESIYFGSGGTSFGFWRKNTRDNNNSGTFEQASDGVDINRNYGFKWGFDDSGSSPNPGDETYRGPSAFSELETQAQRDIVNALKPVTGFSFHTYSDLMIHPWGYTTTPTPDAAAFREWNDELSRDNAYLTGQGPAILYSVNGEFNDWVYGDTLARPRAYTWTPEVGSDQDGFWPAPSRITPLAQEMLRSCEIVAAIAGPFVQENGVAIAEGAMNIGRLTNLTLRARNLAAKGSAGPGLIGTLTALDLGAHVLNGVVSYPTIAPRTSVDPVGGLPFQVTLDDTVTPGRLIRFQVEYAAANAFSRDTIAVPAGTPTILFADFASSGTTSWAISPSGTWGVVTTDTSHPSRYFAHSPLGNYSSGANDRFILRQRLNFSAGVHAYAFYEAKWEYEQNYDGGALEATLDSVTWVEVRATGSTPGSGIPGGTQTTGRPYYAGARRNWKPELADLSAYAGPTRTRVQLRFRGRSDTGSNYDGLAVDSIRIAIYDPAAQPGPVAVSGGVAATTLELGAPFPNPTRDRARFDFALPQSGNVRLEVLDIQGRHVRSLISGTLNAGRYVRGWDLRDDSGRIVPSGIYLTRLAGASGIVTRRLVVVE